MTSPAQNSDHLLVENHELRTRLEEAEELLTAIRAGSVDALVIEGPQGPQVYTLEGADQPYRTYVETMNEGAVTLSQDGTILYSNRQFAELTAASIEETIGASFFAFIAGADQDAVAALLRAGDGGSGRVETALEDRAGTPIPVRISARRTRIGSDEFNCVVVTDLRGQKLQDQLREADQRKNEFLAILGHELRNPLAIMHNVLQVLRKKHGADASSDMREMIEEQVRQMGRLIDDLLDVSRITTGKIRLEVARFDVAKVLTETVQSYRDSLEANGLTLSLELPNRQLFVNGDNTRIAQVIGNLLQNASKFTEGGGKVTVTLHADPDGNSALIRVRDTGMGMDSETLQRVFDAFAQAVRCLARSRGGLGLGLALVKGLVELHGGEVTAASAGPGRGSEFIIRLPIESASLEPGAEKVASVRRTRCFRILVIEDNQDGALSMQLLLKQLGHDVEVAYNGFDGLAAAARFKPQVVLCDIGLPGLDGYQIAQLLRQREDGGKTFLSALSGYGQDEDKRRALEAGFDMHFVKPLKIDLLENVLAELEKHPIA
ncbi:MAG: ATP-binding protein [Candidatus Binatia bacterium]